MRFISAFLLLLFIIIIKTHLKFHSFRIRTFSKLEFVQLTNWHRSSWIHWCSLNLSFRNICWSHIDIAASSFIFITVVPAVIDIITRLCFKNAIGICALIVSFRTLTWKQNQSYYLVLIVTKILFLIQNLDLFYDSRAFTLKGRNQSTQRPLTYRCQYICWNFINM